MKAASVAVLSLMIGLASLPSVDLAASVDDPKPPSADWVPSSYVYDSKPTSTTSSANPRIDAASGDAAVIRPSRCSTLSVALRRAPKAVGRTVDDLDLDALSRSGRGRVGPKLEQHQGGKFPTVTGGPKAKEALGQDQLDDILTAPGSRVDEVTSGNFSGGFRIVSPDGRGATFDSRNRFQYFGEY